jgi:hypothetical protein
MGSFRKQPSGLSEAEKIARAVDPEVWDGMTNAERRETVTKVYEHAGRMLNALNLLRRTTRPPRHRT